ncbi:efflux transporter outer membrane subunit [Altererythrobacter soli]|uniref:Efflux transporter outer membrane subunit n=1 Tax=Croceibacterium soli TaxID=1739690 RepID=A0A6I4UYQ7_9SPHN|nr:efflux transporter outer membrane subunit [Croceibacterium soli]MXP42025.1 efflux transporter outer membrane subunit [Croceibacterium soli]
MRRILPVTLLLLAGCSMNPKLDMPPPPVAAAYPDSSPFDEQNAADLGWREMFGDPRLQQLVELSLRDNRDLRIAVLNVEAARAQFRTQRGAELPGLEAQGSYTRQRTSPAGAGDNSSLPLANGFEFGQFNAQVALTAFEIDLFGRLRSQSQAAFERYLATDQGRRAVQIAVVGAVADAYLAERLAAEQVRLTQATLQDWRSSLQLTRRLHAARQVSGLEVTQAEELVHQAEADLEQRRRELAQATNALVLAVGAPLPADLPAPIDLLQQPIRTQLPAGLPSELLQRRPDVVQAEHELRAANADVGAARAAFFPRLSLTAALGLTSPALDELFRGANRSWSFSPALTAPIFQGGQLQGNLDLAELRKSIAVAHYERSIQAAFREVADGLAARATYAPQVAVQSQAAEAAARRVDLSNLRFRAGVESRLELLDAQRSAYSARQALLNIRHQEMASAIGLYRALGGGLTR